MSKTQDIIDAVQQLMIQSNQFIDVKHYIQSAKDDETFDFPLCSILAESDNLSQLGSTKTQHVLVLTISYLSQSWTQEGNRMSYGFADGLENLLKTNRTLTVGETVVSVYLISKEYGLTELEEATIDGVTCQVEVTYLSDSK
jgi:hypothetical protein